MPPPPTCCSSRWKRLLPFCCPANRLYHLQPPSLTSHLFICFIYLFIYLFLQLLSFSL
jgi:hypothetical protein